MATRPTVVVVGLGYGGLDVATQLSKVARVIGIDARETMVHRFGGPLVLTDATVTSKVCLPAPGPAPTPPCP